MKQEVQWYYYVIALIPSFMGAASYVLSKYIIDDISPISLLFYRWAVALLVLTPFALRSFCAEFAKILANLRILSIIAISGVTLFNLCTYYALQYTSSTNVSIIVSIFPIFVLTLGAFINKDRLNKIQVYSVMLSFTGALIIVSHGHILEDLSSLFHNVGDFIALAASLCWATYVFTVKYKPNELSFLSFTYSMILIGTILIAPLYLMDVFYLGHTFELTTLNVSVILFLGIGVSVIGIMTMNLSIIKIGANTTSILYYLAPLFTSIMAITILGEKFEYFHLVGMCTILLGVNLPLIAHFFTTTNNKSSY